MNAAYSLIYRQLSNVSSKQLDYSNKHYQRTITFQHIMFPVKKLFDGFIHLVDIFHTYEQVQQRYTQWSCLVRVHQWRLKTMVILCATKNTCIKSSALSSKRYCTYERSGMKNLKSLLKTCILMVLNLCSVVWTCGPKLEPNVLMYLNNLKLVVLFFPY